MTGEDSLLHDILHGEGKKLEFKAALPSDSVKYIKTIVAFSNTAGGKIIIGVDDSRNIVGLPVEDIFSIKDTLADTISNMCQPQILPDIFITEIDGKSLLIAEVYPGPNCPYHIRALGIQNGTFVRIGGISRLADENTIKELQYRGSNLRFDEIANLQHPVEQSAIDRLCNDMMETLAKGLTTGSMARHAINASDLINWKVLISKGKELVATNAFLLLTSDYFEFARIQCARFKGNDRTVFIDKKDYLGPLYIQIENAFQFVLNHINLSIDVTGLQRSEQYEVPIRSVREMIVNAVTHRNYMIDSRIQIAVYDNRIEVTSPGTLYGSLDIAAIMAGRSETRNRTIARIFDKMHLIECWGTGIRRIMEDCEKSGLPEPKFSEIGDAFRVEVFRKPLTSLKGDADELNEEAGKYRASTGQVPGKHRASTGQVEEKRIQELIEFCVIPRKRSEMQEFLGLSHRDYFMEAILNPLIERGLIEPTVPDKPTSSRQKYVKSARS